MNERFTVLVNSSDGFEDCCQPFFTLFERYWPECSARIFLNTEKKTWKHPRLDIVCTAVQLNHKKRMTWSECLIAALDQVKTPLVLYFQEDYFIHQPVRADVITSAVEHMINNSEIKHIALTKHGSSGPYDYYPVSGLKQIRQNARYRISTQAGLWRVDTLRSYLKPEENGWMFEIFGTWRSKRRLECFLCANFEANLGGPAIDYLHTGIIKGKWLADIKSVFNSNGIVIDYSQRGIYQPRHPIVRKFEVFKRLFEKPIYLLKQIFYIGD